MTVRLFQPSDGRCVPRIRFSSTAVLGNEFPADSDSASGSLHLPKVETTAGKRLPFLSTCERSLQECRRGCFLVMTVKNDFLTPVLQNGGCFPRRLARPIVPGFDAGSGAFACQHRRQPPKRWTSNNTMGKTPTRPLNPAFGSTRIFELRADARYSVDALSDCGSTGALGG
jgi:hypothetical protein